MLSIFVSSDLGHSCFDALFGNFLLGKKRQFLTPTYLFAPLNYRIVFIDPQYPQEEALGFRVKVDAPFPPTLYRGPLEFHTGGGLPTVRHTSADGSWRLYPKWTKEFDPAMDKARTVHAVGSGLVHRRVCLVSRLLC